MTGDEFAGLLNEFTLSAESGDGARFASHFTEDAIYDDYIYGAHSGRADCLKAEINNNALSQRRWRAQGDRG
jgi:hypothetical protein